MEKKGGEEQNRVDSENNPMGAEVNKIYSTESKSELVCEEQETVNASSTSKGETKPDFDHHTSISHQIWTEQVQCEGGTREKDGQGDEETCGDDWQACPPVEVQGGGIWQNDHWRGDHEGVERRSVCG